MDQELLSSFQDVWSVLRAEADEETALDLTSAGDFANKPSGAVEIKGDDNHRTPANKIAIIMCGGSAAGKTFTYKIYGWARANGPAELICTGTGTLGTQAVVKYPHSGNAASSKFWADTLSCTERWIGSCESSDASGNNEVAKITFDLHGLRWIQVEITDADGATGDEAGDVSAYYRKLS